VTICLVTDRRRLAGAAAPLADARRCLETQVGFAVDAGIDIVQIRERDLEAAVLASIVQQLRRLTSGTRTRLVVNDRLDVALACRADGVHLRADSIASAQARRLAPAGFLIGCSVHTIDEARRAMEADYLIAGTVFPSESKAAAHRVVGADGLAAIAGATRLPVLAIGGVTAQRFDDIARAGAAGFAAIGLFMDAPGDAGAAVCRSVPLRPIVAAARRRFDSVKTRP
jgi:thiamine-phosphate pyrophosphorylase